VQWVVRPLLDDAGPDPKDAYMRKFTLLLTLTLVLAVGCSSSKPSGSDDSSSSTASDGTEQTASTPVSMDIAIESSTTTAAGSADPNAPSGSILMVKLHVGDLAEGEKFYNAVFGATTAVKMGDNVHIVTFPKGGPGLVLLGGDSSDANMTGAFIIQVPNLDAAVNLALANGATKQQEFAGAPGGQAAKSMDMLDPWGNQIEILQIG
jgi:predicted enzyme related to lactoylglutathione lyase